MAAPLQPFRSVKFDELVYAPMIKDTSARLYVVPIDPPVLVTSPPTKTASAFEEGVPFAFLQPEGAFAAFLKKSEDAILDACLANKATWFAMQHEDEALRRGFKSFFKEDGTFKIKVPSDVAFFDAKGRPIDRDDVPAGTTIRAVLELSRVCFGRHEFGSTWKLVQAKLVETECLIIDDPPADDNDDTQEPADGDDSDSDANEFL